MYFVWCVFELVDFSYFLWSLFKFAYSYFLQLLKLARLNYLWMYFFFFSCVGLLCLHVCFLGMFFISIFFFVFFLFNDLIVVQGCPTKIILVFFCYYMVSLFYFYFLILPFHICFFSLIPSSSLFQIYFMFLYYYGWPWSLVCFVIFFVLLQFFCQIELTPFILHLESWFVNTSVDHVFTFGWVSTMA